MKCGAAALVLVLGVYALASVPMRATELAEIVPWLVRLEGGLRGSYTPVEGRVVNWRLAWAETEGEVKGTARRGEIVVLGADVELRVELVFLRDEGRLHWRVTAGRVDLAAWFTALAQRPNLTGMLAGLTVTGELMIAGEGDWTMDNLSGQLRATWTEGTLRNTEQDWLLSGVTISAGGEMTELIARRVPLAIDVRTITTGRFGARALAVRAMLADAVRVEVASVTVEVAGGRVSAAPFSVALAEPRLGVDLTMERVGLQDVAQFVPETLSGARGRVNGSVRINWSETEGVSLGAGRLSLDAGEPAEVRFSPNPGLLTSSLPALVLQYYPGLAKIETGESPLRAERFDVQFSPDGDAEGRSATVRIEGGPTNETLKAPLVLTINVRGPLAPLIKFGTTSGLKMGK